MVYQVVGFSTIQVTLNYILHCSFLGMRGCAHLVLIWKYFWIDTVGFDGENIQVIGWNSLNVMLTFMLTHGLYLISHGYALQQPHAVLSTQVLMSDIH